MGDNAKQIARLPKWAQTELRNLRQQVSRLERQLTQSMGEGDSTRIYLDEYLSDIKRPVPDNFHVVHVLRRQEKSGRITKRIDTNVEDGRLRFMASNPITIRMNGSNYGTISIEDR